MVHTDRVPLLDARLDLTQHLTADERAELTGISLPLVEVGPGPVELDKVLAADRAFGATVFDGLMVSTMRVGEQGGIILLGPGDLLVPENELWPAWMADVELQSAAPVQLALFGNDLLAAAYRWPRLVHGLYRAVGDELRRLTAQLVICQLPRVEDRVLAMLWLLAESWGHVTPGGVRVPLALTHEMLGALVGARRPTITLAVRKLTDDGALLPQDSGWLLLHPPPAPMKAGPSTVPAQSPPLRSERWTAGAAPVPAPDPSLAYAELRELVTRLREQHGIETEHTRERLRRARSARESLLARRSQIAQDALKRRRPPSS